MRERLKRLWDTVRDTLEACTAPPPQLVPIPVRKGQRR